MGNASSICPKGNDEKNKYIANFCTDVGGFSPPVPNMCIDTAADDGGISGENANIFMSSLGGIGGNPSSDLNNLVAYDNSEYSNNYGQSGLGPNGGGCNVYTRNSSGICDASSNTPTSTDSRQGYIRSYQKQANYGDPLMCCLRDFQCNEGSNNDVNGASCFSDDSGQNTCPQSFRATDTMPCQFLTTQYCLGNIGDSLDPSSDLDFTALWVDTTDEIGSADTRVITGQFKVYALQQGYAYKSEDNWTGAYSNSNIVYPQVSSNIPSSGVCQLDPATGLPVSKNPAGPSCPRNAVVSNIGINPAIPYNTADQFNFQNLPPCQSIFWRTLYGNEPKFQNQYWTTNTTQTCPQESGAAEYACETTSNAPQGAACSASPFAGIPTPSGVDWARTTLTAAVNKIKGIYNQGILTPPNLQTNAPFFSWLYSVCSSYPYLCQDFLTDECSNVTPELLDNNSGVRNWCGCYLPDSFYDRYTNDFINKECTPYCNSSSVVPLSQPDGTAPQYCSQSVCIIDDVAIKLAKTEFEGNGGSINFNQMCGSCGSNYQNSINKTNFPNTGNTQSLQTGSVTTKNGSQSGTIAQNTSQLDSTLINDVADITCQCRINNFSLTSLGGSFIGGINLAQSCGGDSKCYGSQTDPVTGQTTTSEVDCSNSAAAIDLKIQNLKATLAKKAESTSNFWAILIVFIVFAIIIVIWLFFVTRGVPEKNLTFSRNVLNTSKTPFTGIQNTRKLVYKGPSFR